MLTCNFGSKHFIFALGGRSYSHMQGARFSLSACLLFLILLPHRTDGGLSGIKVLWMNNDKDKKTGNIGAMSASKLDVSPVGDSSGIFDDTTDRLLQDAIRNIDQLTSVARKLSSENMHTMLAPNADGNLGQSSQGLESMSSPAMLSVDRSLSSQPSSAVSPAKCRFGRSFDSCAARL